MSKKIFLVGLLLTLLVALSDKIAVSQTISQINQWLIKNNYLVPKINKVGDILTTEFYAKKIQTNEAQIGTLNISGVALSPLIVTGTSPVLLYGNGETSTFNGPTVFNRVVNLKGTSSEIGLFVNNSGNVGIGTTTPSSRLDVSGSVRFFDSNSNLVLALSSGDSINSRSVNLEFRHNNVRRWNLYKTNDTNHDLVLARYDASGNFIGAPLTFRNSNGWIGFGTQSPSHYFHF
ncbi:MAG: hypothetical protein N2Z85_00380, partial [Patescibacteria group bacterium]|nr:hypothetical protein [Patescibacteria group bacterium]